MNLLRRDTSSVGNTEESTQERRPTAPGATKLAMGLARVVGMVTLLLPDKTFALRGDMRVLQPIKVDKVMDALTTWYCKQKDSIIPKMITPIDTVVPRTPACLTRTTPKPELGNVAENKLTVDDLKDYNPRDGNPTTKAAMAKSTKERQLSETEQEIKEEARRTNAPAVASNELSVKYHPDLRENAGKPSVLLTNVRFELWNGHGDPIGYTVARGTIGRMKRAWNDGFHYVGEQHEQPGLKYLSLNECDCVSRFCVS